MSLHFDGTESLTVDTPPLTVLPLTMACWALPDDLSGAGAAMSIGGHVSTTRHEWFLYLGNATFSAYAQDLGAAAAAAASKNLTLGKWHHLCGVYRTHTDRSAYLDGGHRGDNGTEASPDAGSIVRGRIGQRGTPLDNNPWDGALAHCATWSVGLTDDEIRYLAAGYSPLGVRPDKLVQYLPLMGPDRVYMDTIKLWDYYPTGGVYYFPEPPVKIRELPYLIEKDSRQFRRNGKPKKPPKNPPTPLPITLITVILDALTLASSVGSFVLTNIKRASKKAGWPFWRF